METRTVLERYSRYYNCLQELGQRPLSEIPTIEQLGISKGYIQSCYKEMKEENFEGNLIDYLCLISTEFILYEWEKTIPDKIEKIRIITIDSQRLGSMEFKLGKKTDKLNLLITKCVFKLIEVCLGLERDSKNLVRGFNKNPDWFFNSRVYNIFWDLVFSEIDKEHTKATGLGLRLAKNYEKISWEYHFFQAITVLRFLYHTGDKGTDRGTLYSLVSLIRGDIIGAKIAAHPKPKENSAG